MTILSFNAALICGTEGTNMSEWEQRSKRFETVGRSVKLTYSDFGTTEVGCDNTDSVQWILGEIFYA